jgi:hypothetical protein
MNIQIILVTDYILSKDAGGKFLPKSKESAILVCCNQANWKMRNQGMDTAKVRSQPILNDGNKVVLRREWGFERIETPMLVFVDFAYGDEQHYNVMSTLYGEDMNATKIYETLEYFALLIRQKGKYIRPDGSEWKPLGNKTKGSAQGNETGGVLDVFDWELPGMHVPILDDAVKALMNLFGEFGAKFLYLGAVYSAKQGMDANNQTAKLAYFALSGYLVFRAETSVEKKK